MVRLRWSNSTDCSPWESHSGTSLPSQCSSAPSGRFCLSSSCAPTPCLPTPPLASRGFCSSCCRGATLAFCRRVGARLIIIALFLPLRPVCLNVAPRRTHCWAWPSWCPISLWDCSTYANSTLEATPLFRMRTSCTGRDVAAHTDFVRTCACLTLILHQKHL